MSTFNKLRRRTNDLAKHLSETTGVEQPLAINIITYARQLVLPGNPDKIDELVFTAQMGKRFGITSRFHIRLIFESMKVKAMKYVKIEDYIRMICIFCTSRFNVKVEFVFNVYDVQQNGHIDYKDMLKLMESSLVISYDDDPTLQLKELIDIVMSAVDFNTDGKVSLEEFRTYVAKDILTMELFGQVLPHQKEMDLFMHHLVDKTAKHVHDYFEHERPKCLCEPDLLTQRVMKNELYRISLELP